MKHLLCIFSLLAFTSASFFPNLQKLQKERRDAEEIAADKLRSIVDQVNAAINKKTSRRDAASAFFGAAFAKKLESLRQSREIQDGQTQLKSLADQIGAASNMLREKVNSKRSESPMMRSVMGIPFMPFHLVKKSVEDVASNKREAEDNLRSQINELVDGINTFAESADSEEGSEHKRVAIFGFNAPCGQLGQDCSATGVHCCGDLECDREWWEIVGTFKCGPPPL